MFYNVLKAKDIIDTGHEKFEHKRLLEKDSSSLTIIGLNVK